jgi:hypothetical protein
LEFIDENGINTIEPMYNSYDIKYCNLDNETDIKRTRYKTYDNVQNIDMIHSELGAAKLEKQNESGNPTLEISMISLTKGVTL